MGISPPRTRSYDPRRDHFHLDGNIRSGQKIPPHPAESSFLSGELDLMTAHNEHPAVVAVRCRMWEGTRSSFMSSRNPIESSAPVPVGSSPYRGPRNIVCAQV